MTAPPFEAVAIGGSAGSIEALGEILPALPASLRAAVLVVLHLPREQPSLLCQIFRHRCTLPLREIQDKEPVEPGTVYFAPPDYHVLVNAGRRLALSIDPPVHFSRPSIDVLFESAADWYGPRLMGVLLSGANADGASGLRAVQSAGASRWCSRRSRRRCPPCPRRPWRSWSPSMYCPRRGLLRY